MNTLYVHIPFCQKICPFCAFAVRHDNPQHHANYLKALSHEMQRQSQRFSRSLQPIESIYIGGGTPSRLSLDEMQQLFKSLQLHFEWSPQIEVAIELNPEDVKADYLKGLWELGVRRISVGIQSFQSHVLKELGRAHTAKQSHQALETLQKSPFDNVNADLIFGFPEHTSDVFQADLETLASFHIPHASLYCLELESKTPFGKSRRHHQWASEHESLQWQLYEQGVEFLEETGLRQYEVSNFAKDGFQGQQNLKVWSGQEYLGLGVGAHSYAQQQRWGNVRHLKEYQDALAQQQPPIAFEETLSLQEQANEALMLALRQPRGLQVSKWQDEFDCVWDTKQQQLIQTLQQQNLIASDWQKTDILQLSTQGLFLADGITQTLMV